MYTYYECFFRKIILTAYNQSHMNAVKNYLNILYILSTREIILRSNIFKYLIKHRIHMIRFE